jgi:hypothetical protein
MKKILFLLFLLSHSSLFAQQDSINKVERCVSQIDKDKTLDIYNAKDTGHDMEKRRFIYYDFQIFSKGDDVQKIISNGTSDDPNCRLMRRTYYFIRKKLIKSVSNISCDEDSTSGYILYYDEKPIYIIGNLKDIDEEAPSAYALLNHILDRVLHK